MRRNVNIDSRGNTDLFWGKAGPGGQQRKYPRHVGLNFLHSLGWTGEKAFKKLEDQMDNMPHMISQKPYECQDPLDELTGLTGGIELVPLLARRRSFKKNSTHLQTCDITNRSYYEQPPMWKEVKEPQDYHRELNNQVINKQLQQKAAKEEERLESRKHFETWGRFWGRPGHGAPKQTKVGLQ